MMMNSTSPLLDDIVIIAGKPKYRALIQYVIDGDVDAMALSDLRKIEPLQLLKIRLHVEPVRHVIGSIVDRENHRLGNRQPILQIGARYIEYNRLARCAPF